MTDTERITHALVDREFLSQCGISIAQEPLGARTTSGLLRTGQDCDLMREQGASEDEIWEYANVLRPAHRNESVLPPETPVAPTFFRWLIGALIIELIVASIVIGRYL